MAETRDYKLGEFTVPRGWFVVAESSQIGATPHSDRVFGEDVVLNHFARLYLATV